MARRMIFHRGDKRVSIGVTVEDDGSVKLAVAACHKRDNFSRRIGNKIVNGRLDKGDVVNLGRWNGESVTREVFGPIRDAVRNLRKSRNVQGLHRRIGLALYRCSAETIQDQIVSPPRSNKCCARKRPRSSDPTRTGPIKKA